MSIVFPSKLKPLTFYYDLIFDKNYWRFAPSKDYKILNKNY